MSHELILANSRREAIRDVRELEQLLCGRGWVTAREIARLRPDWADPEYRRIRRVASASNGILSGPGTPGYRLIAEIPMADLEPIRHAGERLISQGRDMARRGVRYLRIVALRAQAVEISAGKSGELSSTTSSQELRSPR